MIIAAEKIKRALVLFDLGKPSHRLEELEEAKPDYILKSLEHLGRIVAMIKE